MSEPRQDRRAVTCARCGSPVVESARFCVYCGTPLAASADQTAERRVVTVLFGDLSDFTSWSEQLDPERVGVVTDRVLTSLAGVVGAYGGYVDKLTGDGIMAVFGAPTAHEDDPERAVRAARRMQQVVSALVAAETGGGRQLGLRVGLNTGEVLAGVQAHLSYTVIGDTVNTAARLSDAAGVGAVFAGRGTALATLSAASWRALPPLHLKGKRDPVPTYELVAIRPLGATRLGLGDEAPFVGRDAVLGACLRAMLDVIDAEEPRYVLLSGEAGVGKTRLAQEVARFAEELPGAHVLWGRCQPYGEGRDLAAVADMVRTACGIGEADDAGRARDLVRRTVARVDPPVLGAAGLSGLADGLDALLGLDPAPGESLPREGATPGAGTGGDRVRAAVAGLFNALAAQGPLVLVLDDLHWATPVMVAGLRDVARQVHGPVLLVALGRPETLATVLPPDWSGGLAGEVVILGPIDEAAGDQLLTAYLGSTDGALDQQARNALLARAQGNPFFLAELLHLLVDRGLLGRDGDRWRLPEGVEDGLADALLPAGVQAVLAARIDDLDGPAKGVLRDASVLGGVLESAGLEAVGRASGHGDPEVVRAALAVLVDRRLLEPVRDAPDPVRPSGSRFAHTLVRDVAYAGLAKAERARRHAAAAAHEAGSRRAAGSDDRVAAHGERAVRLAAEMGLADDDPAWSARPLVDDALERLGRAALAREDHAAAADYLARALQLAAGGFGPARRVDGVRVAYASALASLHRLDDARAELAQVLDGRAAGQRAAALVVLGEVRRRGGDAAGARQALETGLAEAEATGQDQLTGEALRQLGLLDYFGWRLRDAEERFRQAHALAVRVGDLRGAGWALQHLAWSATSRGDYERADRVLEEAAELFAGHEDTGGLAWVAGAEGFVRLLQGRLTEARELTRSLLPLGEATGERWGVAVLLVIDAIAATELGDTVAAREGAMRALEEFTAVGDVWGRAVALCALSFASRSDGDTAAAAEQAEQAYALARPDQPGIAGLALVAAGYARLDAGDLDAAERIGARADEELSALSIEARALLGAKVLTALVLRRRGRLSEALERLQDALAGGDAPALLFPRRQALAHLAGTLLDLGRPADALELARRAVATPAEDVRSEVLSLRALGSALRACGQEREGLEALTAALALVRRSGPRGEVRATEALLPGSPAAGGTMEGWSVHDNG